MNRKSLWLEIAIIVGASVILALYIFGCNRRVEEDSGYRLVMGTFAHLKAIAKDPRTAKKCVETGLA